MVVFGNYHGICPVPMIVVERMRRFHGCFSTLTKVEGDTTGGMIIIRAQKGRTCRQDEGTTAALQRRSHTFQTRNVLTSLDRPDGYPFPSNSPTYASLLQECGNRKALEDGKRIHGHIMKSGLISNVYIANHLILMYNKCESEVDARQVFDSMAERNVVSWNAIIGGYARRNHRYEAFKLLQEMQQEGIKPDKVTFVSILNGCGSLEALAFCKLVHAHIIDEGMDSDVIVGNALINVYMKCGSLLHARLMFDKMNKRDVVSWTLIIVIYLKNGYGKEALNLFQQMQHENVKPDKIAFVSILNACASPETLDLVNSIQRHVVKAQFKVDVDIGNAFINMYSRCGIMEDAYRMFLRLPQRNLMSWNLMLSGYSRHGHFNEAFKIFQVMQHEGVKPDLISYISILNSCASTDFLAIGKLVHALVVDAGVELDVAMGNALLNMYGKCASVEEAHRIFKKIAFWNVISWNNMINIFARHGHSEMAFKLYQQMQRVGVKLDRITFVSMLNVFTSCKALAFGKLIHSHIIYEMMESDIVVGNALINMYVKCGNVEDAYLMFNKMIKRDVVSWTIMITGFSRYGHEAEAIEHFEQMQDEGLKPDRIALISILNACTHPEALCLGKLAHAHIDNTEFKSDVALQNALVNMYWNCEGMNVTCRIFSKILEKNVVTFYSSNEHSEKTFQFLQQIHEEGARCQKFSFISLLKMCTIPEAIAAGRLLHAYIVDKGFESDIVFRTAVVNMYGKCGNVEDAWRIFNKMLERDLILWNAMIAAYAQHGCYEDAFKLFQEMQQQGVKPDSITFISILNACVSPDALVVGKLVHAHVLGREFESDIIVENAIVNMYGKCGSILDARMVFCKMTKRDVVSWTAMIAAYAQHGYAMEALQNFQQMQSEGIKPNEITLINVLNACNHAGLVDEGLSFFNSMRQDHCIMPTMAHYNCVVDLLGRAGQLDEAEDYIYKMPFQPDAVVWMTLLGSCRIYGHVEQGKCAAECALKVDAQLASAYVVLSNIYAADCRWDVVTNVRKIIADSNRYLDSGWQQGACI